MLVDVGCAHLGTTKPRKSLYFFPVLVLIVGLDSINLFFEALLLFLVLH